MNRGVTMALSYHEEAYDISLFETEDISDEEFEEKKQRRENQQKEVDIAQQKQELKSRIIKLAVMSSLVIFMIVQIIVGQVRLTELNQNISNESKLLEEKKSLYIQSKMKVEAKYSSDIVEQNAQSVLGMSRADSYQKEYISLEEGDKAVVAQKEGENIFEIITQAISSLWS